MRTSAREVFAVAAAAYARGNPLLVVERPETQSLLPPLGDRRVLDLGAGPGHYARLARTMGASLAVAIDLAPEMLAGAPAPAVVGDAGRLPLRSGAFDVVVAALVLSYVGSPERALAEAARALRPRGTLVLSDLHPVAAELGWRRTFEGPRGEELEVDARPHAIADLRRWVEQAGLEIEALREPAVGPALERHFRHAGRRDFEALRGTPLLVTLRATKGGS